MEALALSLKQMPWVLIVTNLWCMNSLFIKPYQPLSSGLCLQETCRLGLHSSSAIYCHVVTPICEGEGCSGSTLEFIPCSYLHSKGKAVYNSAG